MFKVKHVKRNEDIISLDPTWSPGELREWAHSDELVCPGCDAPVNYRKQGVKRAHFAHRALLGCDYADGDSAVIAARALLWLHFREKVGRKPGWKVDVEVQLPSGEMIDVWVQAPGHRPLAYKIFTKGRRGDLYDTLRSHVHQQKAELRPILLSARRSWADEVLPNVDHRLLLVPAADRHMRFWRSWDRYHVRRLGEHVDPYDSICYIDHEAERMILHRNLWRPGECNPAVRDYEQMLEAPVSELLVWRGELIFPEERDALETWKRWSQEEKVRIEEEKARLKRLAEEEAERRRQHEKEREARALQTLADIKAGAYGAAPSSPLYGADRRQRVLPVQTPPPPTSSVSQPTCRHCGQKTSDWWERQGDLCSCNACRIRSRGLEPQICALCRAAFDPTYRMENGLCVASRSRHVIRL